MRVLHLVGSAVDDELADLSALYAGGCLTATGAGHEAVLAVVSPDGSWRFPEALGEDAAPVEVGEAVRRILALAPAAVVPQMFCGRGMTAYRALFEDVLGVPVLGNPADAMALTLHKARARAVVAAAGVEVPRGELLRAGETPGLPLPVVVKPVAGDNSVGVALARSAEELDAALAAAFAHGDEVLVEAYVELGREVRCGLLERDGELVGLPLEEYAVDAASKPIRDAADKLRRDDGGALELVAKDAEHAWLLPLDDPATAPVWAAAKRCHVALGCRDYSLFDFRLDPEGRPFFLEAGLYCSFSPQSVVAVMAAAAGIPVDALFETVLAAAVARGPRGSRVTG